MKKIAAFLIVLSTLTSARADNWPAWRGPTGQGQCAEKNVPLKWSDKEKVKWKVPLAHGGNSTPVVWGDKIFLTMANKGGTKRSLLCFARANGEKLWEKTVEYKQKEANWNESWYCNASPVVDGERVVACFASAGLYCYDHKGTELWKRTDLGTWEHMFGNGASPIIYGDTVIQWCGPNQGKGRNFLIAVNKKTGVTVWEKDQTYGSWCTPVIANVDGKDQLLFGYSNDVKTLPEDKAGYLWGLDPKTGEVIWKCQGFNSFVYTSALYSNGIAVGMSGYYGQAFAVKLGGTGDITKDRLWKHPKNIQRVGSGVIVGDHVYMVDENTQAHCYDLKTGEDQWKGSPKLGDTTWGSIVHADGRLYVLMRDAETVVLDATPKFKVLSTNTLGKDETTNSSLAISNGDIFIRTFQHLWCIGEK